MSNSSIEQKLTDLRAKTMPEFASREDFYAYAQNRQVPTLKADEAFKDIQDNLLPIFKAAKELCEYLSADENYFRRGWNKSQTFVQMYAEDLPADHGDRPIDKLYHMALVSRIIQTINHKCGTAKEKKFAVMHADIVNDNVYINNGQRQKVSGFGWLEENKGFKRAIGNSELKLNYDDNYLHEYLGAFQEDVQPVLTDKSAPVCSASGHILGWDRMKESSVLQIAAEPFIYAEMARLYQEQGGKLQGFYRDDRGKLAAQARKNITAKIFAFCDMKNSQNRQAQILNEPHQK